MKTNGFRVLLDAKDVTFYDLDSRLNSAAAEFELMSKNEKNNFKRFIKPEILTVTLFEVTIKEIPIRVDLASSMWDDFKVLSFHCFYEVSEEKVDE